jgi:hypothetical protein
VRTLEKEEPVNLKKIKCGGRYFVMAMVYLTVGRSNIMNARVWVSRALLPCSEKLQYQTLQTMREQSPEEPKVFCGLYHPISLNPADPKAEMLF